ncbi:unnamed protein product [Lactuca virosa]|uniref:Uncharacterized protein n=1 Tax=Lactuca virosa TaxID=75947 RepID=A0AAU9MD12_9ASTR|nr:unnamed protein product [Lactuca virosa]
MITRLLGGLAGVGPGGASMMDEKQRHIPTIIAQAGELGEDLISLRRRFCEEFHQDTELMEPKRAGCRFHCPKKLSTSDISRTQTPPPSPPTAICFDFPLIVEGDAYAGYHFQLPLHHHPLSPPPSMFLPTPVPHQGYFIGLMSSKSTTISHHHRLAICEARK